MESVDVGLVWETDVVTLTVLTGVSVVTALGLAVTEERCLRNFGKDGIILSRSSGDGFL